MGDRLTGKVAMITGGASGMGLAAVELFISEGAQVVFCDLPPTTRAELAAEIGDEKARLHHTRRQKGGPNDGFAIGERLGNGATFVPADITDPEQLAAVVATATKAARNVEATKGSTTLCLVSTGVAAVFATAACARNC